MKVPIQNLYYLLLYAWDYLEERDVASVGALKSDQPLDLLAYVLVSGMERILKRGLDRGYVAESRSVSRIRGQIDFPASVRSNDFARLRLHCLADDLSYDVLHNQVIKTTLRQLAEARDLDPSLRGPLLGLYRRMSDVREVRVSSTTFSRIRLHRNNRYYRVLLAVCQFAHEGLIADEEEGGRRFREFERDEVKMRLLFEAFIRNLLRRRLGPEYSVGARRIGWQRARGDAASLSLLPSLNMDVVIELGDRILIIDTKYTTKCLSTRFSVDRARSEHLFQLFAYVKNMYAARPHAAVSGLLLYPAVGRGLDVSFSIADHSIRLLTLRLDREWTAIERDVVALVSNLNGDARGLRAA